MNRVEWTLLKLLGWALLGSLGAQVGRGQTVMTQLVDFSADVRNYNLVTLGNATFNSFGDTQGPLAIEGNLSLTGGSVADQPGSYGVTGDPTLFVSGSLNLNGQTSLNGGYASLPGLSSSSWSWNSSQNTLTGSNGSLNTTNAQGSSSYATQDPLTNPGPANWNWTTLGTSLNSISSSLASATDTGTISVSSGNLVFTPESTDGGYTVFTLDASLLNAAGNEYDGQSFSNVQINLPTGVNYVINVINASGATIFGSGVNFNSGDYDNDLLWNIEGSGTVTLGGDTFYGAVLAPDATIQNTGSTVIDGQVAADNFDDSDAELHFTEFDPPAKKTPEPATYALWAAGLCAVAAWRWKRRPEAA